MPVLPRKKAWCSRDFTLVHESRTVYLESLGNKALVLTWSFILIFLLLVLATLSTVCFTEALEGSILGCLCLVCATSTEFSLVYTIGIRAYSSIMQFDPSTKAIIHIDIAQLAGREQPADIVNPQQKWINVHVRGHGKSMNIGMTMSDCIHVYC